MADPKWEDTSEVAKDSTPKWEETQPTANIKEAPSKLKSFMSGIAEAGGLSKVLAPLGDTAMKGITGVEGPLAGGSLQDLLDNYRKQRDSLKKEFEENHKEHPGYNIAGNIIGSAPLAAAVSGPQLAKGATLGAKMLHGAQTGAKIGGVAGLLNSNADLTQTDPSQYGQALKDTFNGANTGMTIGAVAPAAWQGLKSTASTLFPNLSTSAEIGSEGTLLNESGRGKIVKEAEDTARNWVGDSGTLTGKGGLVSQKGQAIKELIAKAGDKTTDVSKLADELTQLFSTLDDRNPLEAQDKKTLVNLLENYTKGTEVTKDIPYTEYTPQKTVDVPAVPSTREKLLAQAEKLNAANKFEGGPSNPIDEGTLGASPYEVKDVPGDNGKNFLGLFNKDKGLQNKLYEDIPGSPANQEITPAQAGAEKSAGTYTTREGGSTDLTGSDLQKLKKGLSGYTYGEGALKSQEGENLSKIAAGKVGEATEQATPGLDEANNEFHNLMEKVLKPLGAKGPGGVADADTQVDKLRNLIRRYKDSNLTGDNSQSDINPAIEELRKINPDMADQMQSEINTTSQRVKVARQAQAEPLTMKTGIGAFKGASLKTANAAGYLFNAPKETIGKLGNYLQMQTSDPATAEFNARLGNVLVEASQRDDVGRNALLFSLMQQPAYRDALNNYFGTQDQ